MVLETKKEKVLYQGIVPILAAVIGALISTWYNSISIDQAQLSDIVQLVGNPDLDPNQKIEALEIYERITDRPWSVIRSLVTFFGLSLGALIGAGAFQRLSNK